MNKENLKKHLWLSVLLILVSSCQFINSEPVIYENKQFGIKLAIPSSLRITTEFEKKSIKSRGNNASKKVYGDAAVDTWKTLLHVRLGLSNNHIAITSSKYDSKFHGSSYLKSQEKRFRGMKTVIENNDAITVEEQISEIKLDSVDFDLLQLIVFKENKAIYYTNMYEKSTLMMIFYYLEYQQKTKKIWQCWKKYYII